MRGLLMGVCGTDREILAGRYGVAPPARERLIIGHESLGRVDEAPPGSGLHAGDLVAGIVRRPDPVPCPSCAAGEWDMCRNGRYTERGIKERDGYGSEWYRLEPEFTVPISPALGVLGVLLEPASIVAKAWDHIERIGRRTRVWEPRVALVTGAGPIGLLAALMAVQRGLEVHVFDRVTEGPKPALVRDLGATYHAGVLPAEGRPCPDITIECTGAAPVIAAVVSRSGRSGIVCLAGISSGGHHIALDVTDFNRELVLENDVVFGAVNANRAHYEAASGALGRADPAWLSRLISRRVPLDRWAEALERRDDDVKVVIELAAA